MSAISWTDHANSWAYRHPLQRGVIFFIITSFFYWCLVILIDLRGLPQWLSGKESMQEMWVQSLGAEDPLEKEMAIHSSILAWRIPWTEEPGELQTMGSQRVSRTRLKRLRMQCNDWHRCGSLGHKLQSNCLGGYFGEIMLNLSAASSSSSNSAVSLSCVSDSKSVSTFWQHQHHLGEYKKCWVSSPTLDIPN